MRPLSHASTSMPSLDCSWNAYKHSSRGAIGRVGQQPRYIRSAVLRGFDTAAISVGIDPTPLLNKVGLKLEWSSTTNRLISLDAFLELLAMSASMSHCHDFGIRAAIANGVPNLGVVSLLMREAANVEAALGTLSAYISHHSDAITVSIEMDSEFPFIAFDLTARSADQLFQANQFWLAGLVMSMRWLAGQDFNPYRVCFTHARKLSSHTVSQFLRCPVDSNGTMSGMLVAREMFSRPLATSYSFLREEALQHLLQTISVPATSLSATVSRIIRRRLSEGEYTLEDISAELKIDRRTLNRWLQPERQTFSSLLQQVRSEAVQIRLNEQHYGLHELAEIAGFKSLSAFCRWFKMTFGCTTSEMRRRIEEDRPT